MGKPLWNIFLNSPLFGYGIGSTIFKNPALWALLTKIDDLLESAENKVVFDIGCGSGVKSLLMALKGARVRGFDADPNAIRNCQKNLKFGKNIDAKFYVWDIQGGLPTKYRGTVDFILCNQVIEHVENYEKALDEMIKVLKPEGRVFITTPNKLTHKLKRKEKVYGEKKYGHHHIFSRDDLRRIITRRKDVKIEEITTHNASPSLAIGLLYKIFVGIDLLHRAVQKIDEKRGTSLEVIYMVLIRPFAAICNSIVYPSILNSYLAKEGKIKGDEGGTIYLVLKKLT